MSTTKTTLAVLLITFICGCNPSKTESEKSELPHTDTTTLTTDLPGDSASLSIKSEITCPSCGYKKMENMPTDVCLLKYSCEKCNATLFPREGDCCVFCTYGSHKCPSKQD
jgi:hypothetical protein